MKSFESPHFSRIIRFDFQAARSGPFRLVNFIQHTKYSFFSLVEGRVEKFIFPCHPLSPAMHAIVLIFSPTPPRLTSSHSWMEKPKAARNPVLVYIFFIFFEMGKAFCKDFFLFTFLRYHFHNAMASILAAAANWKINKKMKIFRVRNSFRVATFESFFWTPRTFWEHFVASALLKNPKSRFFCRARVNRYTHF